MRMSGSRRNTLVFWQHKTNGFFGGGSHLSSIEEANEFARFNNNTDPFCRFRPVTLTDDELKQIADEKSQIKKDVSLEKFNPFSPKAIAYKKEMESFAKSKATVALGLFLNDDKNHNGQKNQSPLKTVFAGNYLFDSHSVKEIFTFLEPEDPFQSITSDNSFTPTKKA